MAFQDSVVDPVTRELRAESITIRIRWFGLAVGYLLVNFAHLLYSEARTSSWIELNAILTLGAVYAMIDTARSWKGKIDQ